MKFPAAIPLSFVIPVKTGIQGKRVSFSSATDVGATGRSPLLRIRAVSLPKNVERWKGEPGRGGSDDDGKGDVTTSEWVHLNGQPSRFARNYYLPITGDIIFRGIPVPIVKADASSDSGDCVINLARCVQRAVEALCIPDTEMFHQLGPAQPPLGDLDNAERVELRM